MKRIKMFLLATMAIMASSAVCAQENYSDESQELGYVPYPYFFVNMQGGVGTTFTDVSFTELLSPTVSIGIGHMFTPVIGGRIHVNAWESKGGFKTEGAPLTYKYNYATTDADIMFNLCNIFSKKQRHLFDLYLIGGIGLNVAWNNDDLTNLLANHRESVYGTSVAWGEGTNRVSLFNHNIRAGLLADFNIVKHWSVGLEVDANSIDDRFNSKKNGSDDWMVNAQLSVTYKFGFKKPAKKAIVAVDKQENVNVEYKPEPKPAPVIVNKPKELTPDEIEIRDFKGKPLNEVIFYEIRQSDPNPDEVLTKVVKWARQNPNQVITITGYADKGTGNSKINKEYSKQRAESVANDLKARGVNENQLKIEYKGDADQPFSENDKNRCTIVAGK